MRCVHSKNVSIYFEENFIDFFFLFIFVENDENICNVRDGSLVFHGPDFA